MSRFSKMLEPYGPGRKAPLGGLEMGALLARMRLYKRTVAKRYRVVPPDKLGEQLPEGTLWISSKVDGELWFLVKQAGEVALCAPNGRVLLDIPVLQEAVDQLAGVDDFVAAGELFAVSREGRPRVKDVARALGDGGLAKTLGMKVFDLVSEGDEDWQKREYAERLERLEELFGQGRRMGLVATVEGGAQDVVTRFDEWVNSGKFEGLVARSEQGLTYKIKPRIDLDVVVLGFGERRTAELRTVRELIMGLQRDDGTFQVLGTVANGLSETDKAAWYRKLEPLVVPSAFRLANSEGTLCRFVRPEVVIQVRCNDILDTDSRDGPIRRMTLAFDADTGFVPLGLQPLVSLIHPVFDRVRDDKPVEPAYVGLEQVLALVSLEQARAQAPAAQLSGSEILARRVFTKQSKGLTAVRKVVVLETHKADEDPDYPPYVVYMTDWSAGRRTPLQTNVRAASTRDLADAYVEAWLAKNVKRGWVEAG